MEKTLKIAALVCHDNVCFDLAEEQKTICKTFRFFPSFPLICPLAKVEPEEKNQNILAQYQNIFQSSGKKPVLQNVEYDEAAGIFFRRLQIETPGIFKTDGVFWGKITLAKANTLPFLFDQFENVQDCKNGVNDAICAGTVKAPGVLPAIANAQIEKTVKKSSIELRVFKLAVFTFFLNNCENFRSTNWQQENSRWIKLG